MRCCQNSRDCLIPKSMLQAGRSTAADARGRERERAREREREREIERKKERGRDKDRGWQGGRENRRVQSKQAAHALLWSIGHLEAHKARASSRKPQLALTRSALEATFATIHYV